jgi:restriction system protein
MRSSSFDSSRTLDKTPGKAPSVAARPAASGLVDIKGLVAVGGLSWSNVVVTTTINIPTHQDLLWPTLEAVKELGGSGTIDEINDRVVQREGFTEEQQAVIHNDGPRSKIEYRLAWSRTYLKAIGALENSERAVWSITDAGRGYSESDVDRLIHDYRLSLRAARRERKKTEREESEGADGPEDGETNGELDWKEQLTELLLQLPPDRFEHLARRLLLEAGFISATVTGRTGDGGIDGIGIYRLSLVSFPVFFQCKRYKGSVRAGAVRDFRGAMAGRGDRGLLITTGTFTAEAKQEATREGAPPIDLIDGDRLCDLLKEHRLGVRTELRQIEDVTLERDFFTDV